MLKDSYYDNIIYLYCFVHFAALLALIVAVGTVQSIPFATFIAILWGFFVGPLSETYSHEFVHRRSLFQQMIGGAVWASFCYGSFLPEHVLGHHKTVSTPEDASSARQGQTLYQFIPEAVRRNPIAGFKLEAQRLRDNGKPVFGIYNRLIWLSMFSLVLFSLSFLVSGIYGLVFFIVHTIMLVCVIETANYIMHYGLRRRQLEDGSYERVSPLHSWNREGLEAFFAINLTRHSDHHAFELRPYPILRHFPESPELPVGYELILVAALFPKWFFSIMAPAVDDAMAKLERWREEGIDGYEKVMQVTKHAPNGS